ncbi:hypothetical protein JOD18_002275 [Gracilibacillus alcaliphilus]|nr:hypothetical protein [Gracilibacillus alcaliphilus]
MMTYRRALSGSYLVFDTCSQTRELDERKIHQTESPNIQKAVAQCNIYMLQQPLLFLRIV